MLFDVMQRRKRKIHEGKEGRKKGVTGKKSVTSTELMICVFTHDLLSQVKSNTSCLHVDLISTIRRPCTVTNFDLRELKYIVALRLLTSARKKNCIKLPYPHNVIAPMSLHCPITEPGFLTHKRDGGI